jgi:hypothetical protein
VAVLHYAGGEKMERADGDPDSPTFGAPVKPERPRDAERPAPERPAIVMLGWAGIEDREIRVSTADLPGQLEELEASGVVGGLNVERLGDGWIVSTHAATQAERDGWLRGLVAPAPVPANVKPFGRPGASKRVGAE